MNIVDPAAPTTIEHEVRIDAPVDAVLAALTTDDGLSAWYGTDMTGSGVAGGEVVFAVAPHPLFRWTVARPGPGRVEWMCVEGPGQSVGTDAVYDVEPTGDGRTTVRLTHGGWTADAGAFRRCNTYWGALMMQLQRYVELGERQPVFTAR